MKNNTVDITVTPGAPPTPSSAGAPPMGAGPMGQPAQPPMGGGAPPMPPPQMPQGGMGQPPQGGMGQQMPAPSAVPSPQMQPPPPMPNSGQPMPMGAGAPPQGGLSSPLPQMPQQQQPPMKRGGTAKPTKLAAGGIPTSEAMDPWYTRAEFRGMLQPEGLVNSHTPGRTDVHNIYVPAGSYVVPADVTSGLGEGNTLAGASVMDKAMHTNPYGIQGDRMSVHGAPRAPAPPKAPMKRGGSARPQQTVGHDGKPTKHPDMVPIVVAGGELIYYPNTIEKKFGSLDNGHKILDKFVVGRRSQTIKEMKKLKGPKK